MGSPLRLVVVGATDAEARRAWAARRRRDRGRRAGDVALPRDERPDPARTARSAARPGASAGSTSTRGSGARSSPPTGPAGSTAGRFDARVLADLERLGSIGRGPVRAGASGTPGRRARRRPGTGRSRRSPLDPTPAGCGSTAGAPGSSSAAPVDLGGIGKGLALRWAWRGAPPGRSGRGSARCSRPAATSWSADRARTADRGRSAIEDPRPDGEHVAVLAIADGAVATSSVVVNRWRAPDGRLVHHLIDPATGEPGGHGSARRDGRAGRSGLGRGLEQDALPRRAGRDRPARPVARARGVVGDG